VCVCVYFCVLGVCVQAAGPSIHPSIHSFTMPSFATTETLAINQADRPTPGYVHTCAHTHTHTHTHVHTHTACEGVPGVAPPPALTARPTDDGTDGTDDGGGGVAIISMPMPAAAVAVEEGVRGVEGEGEESGGGGSMLLMEGSAASACAALGERGRMCVDCVRWKTACRRFCCAGSRVMIRST
jgi:hypothetical protein